MADLQAGTPEWWLKKLYAKLEDREKQVEEFEDWYDGKHPLPDPPQHTFAYYDVQARVAFHNMCRLGVSNFMAPVVDQPASKLAVEGFQFGEQPIAADKTAWRIWQRNYLDADQDLAYTAALKTGQAFALVWFDEDDASLAQITLEDPSDCIIAYQPGSRRKRAAALKTWCDDDEFVYATLYLPDGVYKWVSERPESRFDRPGEMRWVIREVPGEAWPVPNPLGVVPMVELRANPELGAELYGGGSPEFAKALPDQRRINRTLMNMLVTQDHQAFRQRWATGWGVPTDDQGNPDVALVAKASASSLMLFDDPAVKVGEFAQAEFRPFIDAINLNARLIASTTSTPPRAFLLGDLINVAADALTAIEGTFTAKVRRHQRQFGETWEEVLRLALLIEAPDLSLDMQSSVVWRDPEDRTATEQANLAQIKKNLGMPNEVVWATLPDTTMQEARRLGAQQVADTLLGLAAPAPEPAPAPNPMP